MSETTLGSRAGSRLGHYVLKRLLGRSTTGEVYEALDTANDRAAALKLISPALSRSPAFRDWLQREAITVGRLREPHVVPIRDYGELDGEVFIDMPLVEGSDLAAVLKRNGVLSAPRAVNLVWQAASALDAVHSAGLIHRGIKPRNILLTEDDFVYLLDVGIDGAPGVEVGDAELASARWKYSAPELFCDDDPSPSVDVYALTCVLYQCLTGKPPYRADDVAMLAHAHQEKPIPQPSRAGSAIPASFDAVIATGMAKDPAQRYASAAELATAAYEALSSTDQHQTVQIYELSQQATPPLIAQQQPSPALAQTAAAAMTATASPAPIEVALAPDDEPDQIQPAHPDTDFSSAQQPRLSADAGKRRRIAALAAALLVVSAGLAISITHHRGSHGAAGGSPSAAAPVSSADAQAKLVKLLPAGYPGTICTQSTPSNGALAEVTCGRNLDGGGPPSATYSLFADADALHRSFDGTVAATTVVNCPFRIQSPGPWHRAATPNQPSGTLLCGTHQGIATLVWTNEADLMVGALQPEHGSSTLEALYTWWSSHS